MSPVSSPCDVKPIHAEAIKPNWRVASCMSRTFTNQHIRHAQKCAGQGCPAPIGRLTTAWHPIDYECLPITNPAMRNPNTARRDAGRRDKITLAEASSPKQKSYLYMVGRWQEK